MNDQALYERNYIKPHNAKW